MQAAEDQPVIAVLDARQRECGDPVAHERN